MLFSVAIGNLICIALKSLETPNFSLHYLYVNIQESIKVQIWLEYRPVPESLNIRDALALPLMG